LSHGRSALARRVVTRCASAARPELSYSLRGRLYASSSGWLLLSVPNALARGAFDALNEPGVELPPRTSTPISR
jgi:hypothetical protein